MEEWIDSIYNTFKRRVVDGREGLDDINKLDDIAMGRVWTGTKAKTHNLIDELGGLNDAILLAAKEAGILDTDNINIVEYPKKEIPENIKKEFLTSTNLLLNTLPSEVRKEYQNILDINKMSQSGAITILPYSIEIK